MRAIRDIGRTTLQWLLAHRCATSSEPCESYELRAGDDVVGTLRRVKPTGTLFAADTADGSWTFKRGGFLPPLVTVRVAGEQTNAAVFTHAWPSTGSLEFADGRTFAWHATHRRQHFCKWTDGGAHWIIRLTPSAELARVAAIVEIAPRALEQPDLTILIMLGWYVMLLERELSAAAR
jgi:hypothetical protein